MSSEYTITTYSAKELRELFPTAFERALSYYSARVDVSHEASEYYNALNTFKLKVKNETSRALSGLRAYKYVINALHDAQYRKWIPLQSLKTDFPALYKIRKQSWGKPWKRIDCPLTGFGVDEIIIEKALGYCLRNYSIEASLEFVKDDVEKAIENEWDWQASEEYFLETAEYLEWEFTEDGDII